MFFKLIDVKKKYFNGQKMINALNGVSFDVNEGDFISLVGPSGAGKSSLLLILAGLLKPSSGDIYLGAKKLTKLPDREWSLMRKKNIGIIFQKKIIISHLTVYENLLSPITFSEPGELDKVSQERIDALINLFDLNEYKKRYPGQLSGGELQRLIVARALVTKPKILLADEPTGDLDLDASKQLLQILKHLNQKGLTIVMVTHNKILANSAKNIYMFKEGQIEEIIK